MNIHLCYNQTVDFKEWITRKFLDWRYDKPGHAGSAARYAREVLGITPQLLSEWMNRGKSPEDEENINKLYKVFGEELYDALGLPHPDPALLKLLRGVPKEDLDKTMATMKDFISWIESTGTDINSPEADRMLNNLLVKHGLNVMPPGSSPT